MGAAATQPKLSAGVSGRPGGPKQPVSVVSTNRLANRRLVMRHLTKRAEQPYERQSSSQTCAGSMSTELQREHCGRELLVDQRRWHSWHSTRMRTAPDFTRRGARDSVVL